MRTRAAVLPAVGSPLQVEDVDLADPGPTEVLVRIEAAGVCHSDWHYMTGDLPSALPVVPGHEGAGVVERVGDQVTRVRPGDSVCLMWRPRCGHCEYCVTGRPQLCQAGAVHAATGGLQDGTSRLRRADGGELFHLLGVSCFAQHAVVSERAVVPVPADVPAEVAAITGCAVITGVGAVLNVIGACAGQGVVVFGAGGVGLSAVMGAALSGASPIVVVDVVPERLAAARRLGATHTVDPRTESLADLVEAIRPGGLEWAVEAIGRPDTLTAAVEVLRPGGTLVAVGLAAKGRTFEVPVNVLVQREKRVVGSLYGSANPLVDVPKLLELYRSGRLPVDELIGARYPLTGVNEAFAGLTGTGVGRGVLLPGWAG
jgi:Zn-dependent alcohol dehydrogenase